MSVSAVPATQRMRPGLFAAGRSPSFAVLPPRMVIARVFLGSGSVDWPHHARRGHSRKMPVTQPALNCGWRRPRAIAGLYWAIVPS